MNDATSEKAREFIQYMGEHQRPPPNAAEYMEEPVQVGDRVVQLGAMTPDDYRRFAREERARIFGDLADPSTN